MLQRFFKIFNAFKGKTVRVIVTTDISNEPRKFFDDMVDFATKECGAKGLAWLKLHEDGTFQGPIAKFIDEVHTKELIEKTGIKPNQAIFFVADQQNIVANIAGEIRKELGNRLGLIDNKMFRFCWIVDFPI